MTEEEQIILTNEQKRVRRSRSIAIGIALSAFVVLLYAVTIVKFGPEVLNKGF